MMWTRDAGCHRRGSSRPAELVAWQSGLRPRFASHTRNLGCPRINVMAEVALRADGDGGARGLFQLRLMLLATEAVDHVSAIGARWLGVSALRCTSRDLTLRSSEPAPRPGICMRFGGRSRQRQSTAPRDESKRYFLGEVGWLMGLEPTTTGITIQGSTN